MADDLKDLASRIQRAREKANALTPKDLNDLADRITEAGKQSRIDPKELANSIAKSTAASITSRIPTLKDIAGAFLNSSPILRIASTVFSKSFSSVNDLLSGARVDQSKEAEKLLKEIERMRSEMSKEERLMDGQYDYERTAMNEQTEILKDILDQARILTGLTQEEDKRKGLERMQSLDNKDKGLITTTNPNEATNKLLGKMLVLQERSLAVSILQSVGGFFKGIGSMLTGLLGGLLTGGGVGALLGSVAKGVGFLGRLAGPVGLFVAGAYEFYEGFQNAAKFLGDENVSIMDKLQYAGLHLVSSILAPFDWAVEYFTGEESNIRDKFETMAWDFRDSVMSYIQPALDMGLDAMKWIGSVVADVFSGINMDTKLVDLPGIMADNITGLFIRAWNSIDIDAVTSKVSAKLQEGEDFATNLYESILKTTTDWFKTLYDNMLEWIASGLEENLGSTFGGFLAGKTRDMKTEGNAPTQKTEEGLWSGLGNRLVDSTKDWFGGVQETLSNSVRDYNSAMSKSAAEAALRANAKESQRSSQYNPDTMVRERAPAPSMPPVVQQNNVNNTTTNVSRGMQVDPPGFGYKSLIPST